MVLIRIIKNNEASYYLSQKEAQKINAFAEVINSTNDSDIKIRTTSNPKAFIPMNISLEDCDLRYFDLIEMFRNNNVKPSEYTINRIAEECAYNANYCDFVCDLMVKLTEQNAVDAEIGKLISESVINRALKILEKHKEFVTNAYYKFSKSYNMSFCKKPETQVSEKMPEMSMEEGNNSVQYEDNNNAAIGKPTSNYPGSGISTCIRDSAFGRNNKPGPKNN